MAIAPRIGSVLAERTVASAMNPGVITCRPDTSLRAVAELLARHRVHAVVVYEHADDDAPWGVISALDLVAAALVRDVDDQVAAASAATAALMIGSDETLERAAQLMTEHAVAHLLVVDPETAVPVGVVSTLDIARALSR
jgi:CBS domain-containing protein